jgi:hypothetical protein
LSRADNITAGDGKGRCFADARDVEEGPGECRSG